MAVINVDDIYILDNTGQQVDDAVDYGLFNSNDNLLDNAYFVGGGSQLGDGIFPINQRGQTSYSANAYDIDRWICYGGAITLDADGLSIPANGVFTQPTVNRLTQLNGQTLTISVLYDTGIETGTATLDLSGTTMFINNGAAGQTYITSAGLVQTYKGTASKVKTIKLEKGTVSTLANDMPPDFRDELRKCKAYFQRVKQPQGYTAPIGFGIIGASSNILRTLIPLSSPLRDATSITASATNIGQMKVWGNGSYFTPSAITGRTVLNGHAVVDITVSGSLQNYMVYHIILEDASTYIDLSAEL